jgi:hypothetical protein
MPCERVKRAKKRAMPTAKTKRREYLPPSALAKAIAARLFTTPFRGPVVRLVQELDSESPGHGWGQSAVADIVQRELDRERGDLFKGFPKGWKPPVVAKKAPKRKAARK